MSDDPFGNRSDGPNRRNQEPQFNWRGFMLFVFAIFLLAGGIWASNKTTSQKLNYADFKRMVVEDRIDRTQPLKLISYDTTNRQLIRGFYFEKSRLPAPAADAAAPSSAAPVD
ncbi:MAG: hypothetical protein JNG86_06205 [Verrucomicrobiaceae bacterium]|nr:hypothetical protein [Verrucomicrobiaceae bacterium]